MDLELTCAARVYRDGQCVCQRAEVRIDHEPRRVGLTTRESQRVRVRFQGAMDRGLERDLAQIVERRGASAIRYAERIEPVVIGFYDETGYVEIEGRIEPPQVAPKPELQDTDFPVGAP